MLAALFLLVGLFRIVVSLVNHVPYWGCVLSNGVVTLLLGIAMWREWPESSLWALGTFVGVELIINGATWSASAVGVRKGLSRLPIR
jgi:uncharacterized membrane protein HdeD (DUF308 family)